MKKLRNKVFWVIFLLLSSFTFIVFISSTMRSYFERKNSISDVLSKVSMDRNFGFRMVPNEDSRRIYLDFTIYTVVLDENGNYGGIINHTNNDEFDSLHIKNIAVNIIKNHDENFYIGNLYFSRYAYFFSMNNTLVIMDNSKVNSILISELFFNITLFVLCEFFVFIIASFITKWIITPVKKSFMKQKVFVADASHELKTPLSVIVASCDAYFNDHDDKWVNNIRNESNRMIKLVTELLDLAKTEEEQEVLLSYGNLSDVILGSILTFESLFYDNKIKFSYDVLRDIMMMFNEDMIVELMSILIDNAIRHCFGDGEVSVNLFSHGKQIVLEVSNTGLPINKEDEEKIFERFYKVDSSRNRNSNNYGLGLAIAKNIVFKHNGVISAHSSDGYTVFKVVWNQK